MTGGEVKNILADLGIRPSRKLGQNFLVDPNMRDALVDDANPQPGESILEIGPGLGAMTEKLLALGCRVTAVEIDHRLAEYLRGRFSSYNGFTLLEADACKIDYDRLFGDARYRCIANLPYSSGTVILTKLAAASNPPRQLDILLQLEMAQRLAAVPRTKAYGALTLQIKKRYDVELTRKVPAKVFYPSPEVGSASIRLLKRETDVDELSGQDYAFFCRVVKTGFAQRRKRLFKLLCNEFDSATVESAFRENGTSHNARAEELSVAEFTSLVAELRG